VTEGWRAWFAEHRVDVLLEPTVPLTARPRGDGYDPGHLGGEGDPLIAFTATWNFTGFPVATVPAGLGRDSGLPVGVSLIAPHDAEAVIVQAALDLQERELPPPAL
jgi:Asp-tRNA(Asn)/Glu-tRNA(Gln) amidotransferase A subunit family amidase